MHTEQQTATAPKAVTITTGHTMQTDPLSPSVSPETRLNTDMTFGVADTESTRDPSTVHRGDFVDYVLPSGYSQGQERTAIVVRKWMKAGDMVQLQVFTDGPNDGEAFKTGLFWATSVHYAEPVEGQELKVNTWHWPSGE